MNNSSDSSIRNNKLEIKQEKRGRPKKEPTKIVRIPKSLEPTVLELKELHKKLTTKS